MNIFRYKLLVILIISVCIGSKLCAQGQKYPNVVFILADDIGLGDVGYYHKERTGNEPIVPTPNIDQLIKDGIRFSDAHSSTPLCSPTRYSIMTGNYTHRCYKPQGVWDPYVRSAISAGEKTVAQVAKQAGYQTSFIGKWHLGSDWKKKGTSKIYREEPFAPDDSVDVSEIIGSGPNEYGFDYALCLPSGIQSVPYAIYENGKWKPMSESSVITHLDKKNLPAGSKRSGQGDSKWDPSKIGSILTSKAIDVIHGSSTKIPFFIYYCSQAVHHPHTPPDELNSIKIKGIYPSGHMDMIRELDVQVGMIMDAVKQKGVYENTLFMFTSDNGGMGIEETLASGHDPSNGYRDFKASIYEGGHRVPFIAVWPGKIKAGSQSDELIVTHDLMSTLYRLTNQDIPADQAKDSKNILPVLMAEKNAKGHQFLIQQGGYGIFGAIRQNEWKLIIKKDKATSDSILPVALFNLKNNPFEKEEMNLVYSEKYNKRIKYLREKYISMTQNISRTTPAN